MPAWSLVRGPPFVPERLHPPDNALLPRPSLKKDTRGFGSELSPDHFRRKTTRPVSYYALFK